jgi:hypothetical protein
MVRPVRYDEEEEPSTYASTISKIAHQREDEEEQ